jgi:hypothetical protein
MDPQRWLNELQLELQKRRLPRRYVMRLLRELSDHVTDEWENSMGKDDQQIPETLERLGSLREVAESAEQQYRSRKFAARHPVWTFGVCPPLLLLVVVIGIYMGSALLVESLLDLTPLAKYQSSKWVPVVAQGYIMGCIVLASVVVAVAFAMLAKRSALTRRWPMTAAIVIALLCGGVWTDVTPKTPEQMGRITIGLSGYLRPSTVTFPQVIQFGVPLAVAAWITRRRSSPTDPSMDLHAAT